MLSSAVALLLIASLCAAKDSRTFAVNHFYGKGPLVEGRMDPLVSPGVASSHAHAIQGGNKFAMTLSDTDLLSSTCTSSLVKNDKSAYWTPMLYFQDPQNGSFISVPMFYMNVYYFFEATDDEIVAFQPGHRMFVGDTSARAPPATGGKSITDANAGTPQPIQWTCPHSDRNMPSYPVNSDGLHGSGIQDPTNLGAGVGFPDINCDGYASPLRADIHFPSCYNPAAGLDNYKNNMAWPSSAGTTGGKQNCPEGYVHTPHIFYEVYWNTPLFADLWEQGQGKQPFVLSNGDNTGYSLHADFISGWDVQTLQQIIDNCDAGDSGMDKCPGLIGGLNDPSTSCNIQSSVQETILGVMEALPGNNPVSGWGVNAPAPVSSSSSSAAVPTSIPASGSGSTSATASASSPPSGYSFSPVYSAPEIPTYSSSLAAASSTSTGAEAISTPSSVASAPGYVSVPVYTETPIGMPTTMSTSVVAPASSSPATSPTSAASSPGTVSTPGWTYSGCYSDIRYQRVLSGITFANLGIGKVTSSGCIAYCGANGYSIAGTEYAGQCFCGNELEGSSQIAESNCSMPCEGDGSQICGGGLALSVYETSSSASWKSKRSHRHFVAHGVKGRL